MTKEERTRERVSAAFSQINEWANGEYGVQKEAFDILDDLETHEEKAEVIESWLDGEEVGDTGDYFVYNYDLLDDLLGEEASYRDLAEYLADAL